MDSLTRSSWSQEWEGWRERPQRKTSILYQKKGKHSWPDKTKCPPHSRSWTGSKCFPLLNAAVLPNPTRNHHIEVHVHVRPGVVQCRRLAFSYVLPALPVFPDTYNSATINIVSILLLEGHADLSAEHDVGGPQVMTLLILLILFLSPKERRPRSSEEVGPTWMIPCTHLF